MTTLGEVSQGMGSMVEAAGAAVVRVEARRRFPASGFAWSEDGLIVTANHSLKRDDNIVIGLADGTVTSGELVARDPSMDLALLKADIDGMATLQEAREDVRVGNLVMALARPGSSIQATLGIVSAVGPGWRTKRGGQADKFIQTDVLMYPGFSGGPLVNADGALIGLNSSALMHGVSVTLPISTLKRVIDTLLQHGRVRRGYLGVSTQIVRLQDNVRKTLDQKSGLLIVAVEPGSPAEQGGLTIGDTIVKIGSTVVRRHDDLLAELMQSDIDEKTPLAIVRGGEVQTLNVRIGDHT